MVLSCCNALVPGRFYWTFFNRRIGMKPGTRFLQYLGEGMVSEPPRERDVSISKLPLEFLSKFCSTKRYRFSGWPCPRHTCRRLTVIQWKGAVWVIRNSSVTMAVQVLPRLTFLQPWHWCDWRENSPNDSLQRIQVPWPLPRALRFILASRSTILLVEQVYVSQTEESCAHCLLTWFVSFHSPLISGHEKALRESPSSLGRLFSQVSSLGFEIGNSSPTNPFPVCWGIIKLVAMLGRAKMRNLLCTKRQFSVIRTKPAGLLFVRIHGQFRSRLKGVRFSRRPQCGESASDPRAASSAQAVSLCHRISLYTPSWHIQEGHWK